MKELIQFSNVCYNNALDMVKDNNISGAIEVLEKGMKYYYKDEMMLNLIGLCKFIICRFDKATFYWKESLKLNSKNNKASKYIDFIKSEEFKEVLNNYNFALDYIKNENYLKAIEILTQINKENKELIEPLAIIGLCYLQINQYENAEIYISKARELDIANYKYFNYLNYINKLKLKREKKEENKHNVIRMTQIGIILLITAILIIITFYYKEEKGQLLEKYDSSLKELDQVKVLLEQRNKELIDLKELEDVVNNDSDNNVDIYIGRSESEIFNSSFQLYKGENYSEALVGFKNLVYTGVEEIFVAESTFFVAVCEEKLGNYNNAQIYYDDYIKRYKDNNYADDSLYNSGLMLYKQGKLEEAKAKLLMLTELYPDSIFYNSKVEYILKK